MILFRYLPNSLLFHLTGRHASRHLALHRLGPHHLQGNRSASSQSQSDGGSYTMSSWTTEASPISPMTTIIYSTVLTGDPCYKNYVTRCLTSTVPSTLASTIPSSTMSTMQLCVRRWTSPISPPINKTRYTISFVSSGLCLMTGASSSW